MLLPHLFGNQPIEKLFETLWLINDRRAKGEYDGPARRRTIDGELRSIAAPRIISQSQSDVDAQLRLTMGRLAAAAEA